MKLLDIFGEKKSICEWAKDPRCRVSTSCFYQRIRVGWDARAALLVPSAHCLAGRVRIPDEWKTGEAIPKEFLLSEPKEEKVQSLLPIVPRGSGECVVDGNTWRRLYDVWSKMKYRCYKKDYPSYGGYGAKGVRVCDEWKNSLVSFYEWAMENGWKPGTMLIRLDNEADFSPENCKFVSQKMNPFKSARMLTYQGETKSMRAWERDDRCSVCHSTIKKRLDEGWSEEAAITLPL